MKAHKKRTGRLHPAAVVAIDVLLICAALVVYALFDHVLPHRLSADLSKTSVTVVVANNGAAQVGTGASRTSAVTQTTSAGAASETASETASDATAGGWSGVSAGKFTDGEIVETDTTYVSDTVNVTLSQVESDGVTYYVEDIYVSSVESLRAAFAGDSYGKAITDSVLDMAVDNDAIAAVNGDYYGIGSNGVVIRNGVLYSSVVDGEVCVLFRDGTVKTYTEQGFDAAEVMAAGAWQAWDFGPSLLSDDGSALVSFSSSRIAGANPRTAFGYYEPGHYCFVVVDGRQAGYSDGMSLESLSALMDELGCAAAYNLDGGKSSIMTFADAIANQPTDGGREVTDIVYVTD